MPRKSRANDDIRIFRVTVDNEICIRRDGIHADRAAHDLARDSRKELLSERDNIGFLTRMRVPVEMIWISRYAAIVPRDLQARQVKHRKSIDFAERAVADIN